MDKAGKIVRTLHITVGGTEPARAICGQFLGSLGLEVARSWLGRRRYVQILRSTRGRRVYWASILAYKGKTRHSDRYHWCDDCQKRRTEKWTK